MQTHSFLCIIKANSKGDIKLNLLKRHNKLTEIELMRAISCILVVVIHVTASFWYTFSIGSFQYKAIIVLNTLSKFAVPSFVFMSGFVLYYTSINKEFKLIPFYKRRFSKILIPYLIWSTLYIVVNYILYRQAIDIKRLAYYYLLGKGNYHLYFVCLIVQLYLVFPFFFKAFKNIKNKIIAITLFLIINVIFIKFIKLPFSDRLFPYYMFFFVLGFFLADFNINKKDRKLPKLFLVSILIIYFVFTSYYILDTYKVITKLPLISKSLYKHSWWYFSFLSILSLYIISIFLKKKFYIITDNKIVNSISKHSFTIYLSHPMFMRILHGLDIYNNLQKKAPSILFIAELFGIFLISWLFSYIISIIRNTFN